MTTSRARDRPPRQAHEELARARARSCRTCPRSRRPGRGSAISRSRSSRMPSVADRSRASGCGRRVSLNRRTSAALLASRKMSTGLSPRICRSRGQHRGNAEQKVPSRTSTTIAHLLDVAAAHDERGQRRNERRRQVVDAEVAEVLERPDRLRLPGTGEAGQHDERRAAPRRCAVAAVVCTARARPRHSSSGSPTSSPRRSRSSSRRRARAPGGARARAAADCGRRPRRESRCSGPAPRASAPAAASAPGSCRRHRRVRAARTPAARIPAFEPDDELDRLDERVDAMPNRSFTLMTPRPRSSM